MCMAHHLMPVINSFIDQRGRGHGGPQSRGRHPKEAYLVLLHHPHHSCNYCHHCCCCCHANYLKSDFIVPAFLFTLRSEAFGPLRLIYTTSRVLHLNKDFESIIATSAFSEAPFCAYMLYHQCS